MKIVIAVFVALLSLAACSPSDTNASELIDTTVAELPESGSTTSISVPSEIEGSSTASSTVPVLQGPSFVDGLELGAVLLHNPTSGGGDLPELGWDRVDGVDRYNIFVFDAQGDLYWSWSTTENALFVGGIETDNPDAPGPRILPGMTWAVLGIDASGALVAQSEMRPISP